MTKGRGAFPFLIVCTIFLATKHNQIYAQSCDLQNSNPLFGENVYVFDPQMPSTDIQQKMDCIYKTQVGNEFGNQRFAVLFKPGIYHKLDIKVGYNTQIAGLGSLPDHVKINGTVRTQDGHATYAQYKIDHGQKVSTPDIQQHVGALNNFWRSVENLYINLPANASYQDNGIDCSRPEVSSSCYPIANSVIWAVSQASPMRRLHLNSHLNLFAYGWASGGFMADVEIDGTKNDWPDAKNVSISSGPQQQWFSRNISLAGSWYGANWNMVLLNAKYSDTLAYINGTASHIDPQASNNLIAVSTTKKMAEKPFLMWSEENKKYAVYVPAYQENSSGSRQWAIQKGTEIPIDSFFIAKPSNTSSEINDALSSPKYKGVVFTPGIYALDGTLEVKQPNTIILGLGLANLYPTESTSVLHIHDVDGVRVSGLVFDAGPKSQDQILVRVGDENNTQDHSSNPTILYDLFCRVGGNVYTGKAKSCLTINSNSVIGDDFWLWRADHGNNVGWTENTADNGLTVNGNNVTIYGLAVEHFQKYQTIWNGDNGSVYFYQSEIPYDPPSIEQWKNSTGGAGYASYYVGSNVKTHNAYGIGIYSYFKAAPIKADQAIQVDSTSNNIKFTNIVINWLNGYFDSKNHCSPTDKSSSSGIMSIVNGQGSAVYGCYTNNDVSSDYNLPMSTSDFIGTSKPIYLKEWTPSAK